MRGVTSYTFSKQYDREAEAFGSTGAQAFEQERKFLERLQGSALVPDIVSIDVDAASITMVHHMPLLTCLALVAPSSRAQMRDAVAAQVRALHTVGVCHRDIHLLNIVVSDRPLFVDFELAVEVDAVHACYDEFGPSAQIPLPGAHANAGLVEGVWWDTPSELVPPLWRAFGRLH